MEEKKSGKSKGKKKIKKKKEKKNEIKELKYRTLEEIRNSEKKENDEYQSIETTRAYLEQYCTPIIQEAMISCAKARPINPIEYIGNYLLERAHGKGK